MAVNTNGKPAELAQKGAIANGHATQKPRKPTIKKQKSMSLFSLISRLLTWYSLITIFFRCPSTVDRLTETSPKICKPYFQLRTTVAPHLEPYYDTYAAPYVDAARPYYNTLDKRVITPATALGIKYGAPRVAQAQAYGQAQWEKNLQPQVQRYQGIAKEKYDQTLAPHVNTIVDSTGPYYEIAKSSALQTYYEHLLPAYDVLQPYALHGYSLASYFTVNTVIPYSQWAWATGIVFLDRTVWPKLRILYGENVEPQLVRIGERLGRYRDGKKLKAAVEEIDISSSASSASETISSIASSVSAAHATTTSTASPSSSTVESSVEPEKTPPTKEEVRENARTIVANDLKTWQEKFAKAADEGSDELEVRINEITDRIIQSQADGVGKAMIIELEETAQSSFNTLKSKIKSLVKNAKEGDDSEDALNLAVRKAGIAIKDKAQAVRSWRKKNDEEMDSLIDQASEDTFEIIDHIRDLGLQEIGMRWAWTDGITHKDWSKYHQLKTTFDEWRKDVENVVSEHPGRSAARQASEDVENSAMEIASNAAKELSRLKETGRWKLSAGDASDDFNTKHMPAAAANAGQKILENASKASEAIAGTSQGSVESAVSAVSSSVSSVANEASSSIIGTSQGTVESIASVAKESVSSLAAQASSLTAGEQPGVAGKVSGSIKSAASVASSSVSSLSDAASSSISSGSSVVSSVSSSIASSLSKSATDASTSISSSASSASVAASKKVWGGAQAQFVEAREIVFEDIVDDSEDDTFSDRLQSLASEAGDRYADITKAVSEALLKPTQTVEGYQVTKLAAEQYSSALSAASVALYGTEKGTGESVSSLVASRYSEAVSAASSVIYGRPVPVTDFLAAQATEAYSRAVARASAQYSHARSIVSGKPKPAHKELLSSAQSAYSDSVSAASSRLQAAISGVSTAVYGTPTPEYQATLSSLSAVAQSKLSEGLAAASARYDDGLRYVGAINQNTPKKQQLSQQMQEQFYAGIGMAHAQYSEFLNAASSVSTAVIGSETPWTESAASAASSNWEALITKASSQIYGAPTPYFVTRRLISEAKEYAAQATDGVISQYSAVQSLIGELISGKEPDFTESVYNRLSSAYYTGAAQAVSSASSYASEAYESASSVVSSVFTPPPTLEAIIDNASSRVNEAVEAASVQFYGTQKGAVEQATEAAHSAYSSVQSVASEKIYGSTTGYAESAQTSISEAISSAQKAISEAIYGTQTGTIESLTSLAADTLSGATSVIAENVAAATSVVGEQVASAQSAISSAIYGPEQQAVESAQARLSAAVESARLKLAEFAQAAGTGASDAVSRASAGVEDFASSVSSAVEQVTGHVRDEL